MTWLLTGKPLEVQEEAMRRVAHAPSGFNYFMEMGLGKTATELNEFVDLKFMKGLVDKLVIFAPFTICTDWEEATQMWTGGRMTAQVWPWKKPNWDADVFILYYESISVGGQRGLDFLDELSSRFRVKVALDESIQIKRHDAVRTKALLTRRPNFPFKRTLCGAPMVQGPQDVWSQLKWTDALDGVNYFQFRHRYCQMGGFKGKEIVGVVPERLPELNAIIDACSFRAKKEDWLADLPPKTYFTRRVAHSAQQAKLYQDMLHDFLVMIDSGEIEAPMVITQMLKLQQISSGFIIDGNRKEHPIPGPNAKLTELKRLLDEEIVGKAIVPVYFRYSVSMLLKELTPYGVVAIMGGQDKEETRNAKLRFNNDNSCRVILCQQSASKYGHTLLGDQSGATPDPVVSCAHTVFYENSFSLDDRIQVEDRNHRKGQRLSVNIIDLVSSGVEDRVVKALQRKKNLAEAIIDAVRTVKERK